MIKHFKRPHLPCPVCGTEIVADKALRHSEERGMLLSSLQEAALQLEYMQEKMPTGTSAAVLARINRLLTDVGGARE